MHVIGRPVWRFTTIVTITWEIYLKGATDEAALLSIFMKQGAFTAGCLNWTQVLLLGADNAGNHDVIQDRNVPLSHSGAVSTNTLTSKTVSCSWVSVDLQACCLFLGLLSVVERIED